MEYFLSNACTWVTLSTGSLQSKGLLNEGVGDTVRTNKGLLNEGRLLIEFFFFFSFYLDSISWDFSIDQVTVRTEGN